MAKGNGCGVDFLRGFMLIMNILFILVGLALVGIGIYIKLNTDFASVLSDLTTSSSFDVKAVGFLAFVLIGGGVFTLLIALLGCAGALWHKRWLLFMYATIIIILMILELAAVILAVVYKGKMEEFFKKPLEDVFKRVLENDTAIVASFQNLEKALGCCGVDGIGDYKNRTDLYSEECKKEPTPGGCYQAIFDFFNNNLPVVYGILAGILGIELFGLIGSCVLARVIRNSGDSYSSTPSQTFAKYVPGRRGA